MIYKWRRLIHAIWAYLNQPITPNPEEKSVWKFKSFFYLYQIKLLESCWLQEPFIPNHEISGQDEYRTGN